MSLESKNENERLADELLAMERTANGEVGIPFVRTMARSWREGDVEDARQMAWNENDKLRQFPEIRQWLEEHLFGPDVDSPVKLSKRSGSGSN